MKKMANFFTLNPFGIFLSLVIPNVIYYLTIITKPLNKMFKFISQDPIILGFFIITISGLIIISVIRYILKLISEKRKFEKKYNEDNERIRQCLENHGGHIAYIMQNYEKKPDAIKHPLYFDNRLLGVMGWLSQEHREAFKNKENEDRTITSS